MNFISVDSAKNQLQEYCQQRYLPLPVYFTLEKAGPDHSPLFQVRAGMWEERVYLLFGILGWSDSRWKIIYWRLGFEEARSWKTSSNGSINQHHHTTITSENYNYSYYKRSMCWARKTTFDCRRTTNWVNGMWLTWAACGFAFVSHNLFEEHELDVLSII